MVFSSTLIMMLAHYSLSLSLPHHHFPSLTPSLPPFLFARPTAVSSPSSKPCYSSPPSFPPPLPPPLTLFSLLPMG